MLDQGHIKKYQQMYGVLAGIDRVVLGVPIGPDKKAKYAAMMKVREGLPYVEPAPTKLKEFKYAYEDGTDGLIAQLTVDGRKVLTVVAGRRNFNPYVHIVFNPSRLHASDWTLIEIWSAVALEWPLSLIFDYGNVVVIELFADLPGVLLPTVIPLWSPKIERYDYHGKVSTTIYGGKRGQSMSIACYDKKAQQDAVGLVCGYDLLCRFELRLSLGKKSLRDFVKNEETNLFAENLFVVTPETLQHFCEPYHYKELFDELNAKSSLGYFNPPAKKQMVKELQSGNFCITEWQPEKFWSAICGMRTNFFPDLGGPTFYLEPEYIPPTIAE